MLRILDQYIIKKFLGTFLFILTLIMAISIVFDVSERISKFIENEAPLDEIIVGYYLNFVIYYSNIFSSLLIFISVILFTSKLASKSEIIAMLASGVSFKRILRPYFIGASILTVISLIMNHFIVPNANKRFNEFHEKYVWNEFRINDNNLHCEYESGSIAYVESINVKYNIAYQFSLENWKDGKLTYKLLSDRAVHDSTTGEWQINNYAERIFNEDGSEILNTGFMMDTTINLKPSDFGQRNQVVYTLDYFELNKQIKKERLKGSDRTVFFELEKHQRTSFPLATFILTIIGVSVSSKKVRGGTGLHIAFGLISAVIYIFMMKITSVSATNAGLDPLLAVWIPNFCFLGLSIYLYRKAPK